MAPKEKKKNSAAQAAGGLVAQGSFGCVYTPPLPCAHSKRGAKQSPQTANMVTKVYSDSSEMQSEWNMAKRIAQVDPKQRYFVYATDHCSVNLRDVELQSGQSKEECEAVQHVYESTVPAVRMPHGGVPFHDWLVARRGRLSIIELAYIMLPLLEGIRLFVRNDLVHQDIKANNVVVGKTGLRFIDFSFTVRASELLDPEVNQKMMSSYWVYPPEYRIRKVLSRNRVVTESEFIRFMETEESLLSHTFKSADFDKLKNIRKYFWEADELEMHTRNSFKRALAAKTSISAWSKFTTRVDVYSLGLLMMWASQHSATFLEVSGKKKAEWLAFRELVRSMTCPNPLKRATIAQAIKQLMDIVAKFKVKL